jgi:hypothetical protein
VTFLGQAAGSRLADLAAPNDPDRRQAEVYAAPEGLWARDADRVRLDVFALGALAYLVLTGQPPACDRADLRERLLRDSGLDLAADLPQAPPALRALLLEATRPAVGERLADVPTFLARLADAERALATPEDVAAVDPLDAAPGALLEGRFRLERRLGAGSTAVGLLVHDLGVEPEARRVLKVAVDDAAGGRLADEAAVLAGLDSPRIVRLVAGPLDVGGRKALLLESAGEQTLGDVLRSRARLSLDLLERWGTELLEALVALDRAGVDHRDVKPANLGVREGRGDRVKHLVLFDFSLARAAASAVTAGTPPYLDPFLDTPGRGRYDSRPSGTPLPSCCSRWPLAACRPTATGCRTPRRSATRRRWPSRCSTRRSLPAWSASSGGRSRGRRRSGTTRPRRCSPPGRGCFTRCRGRCPTTQRGSPPRPTSTPRWPERACQRAPCRGWSHWASSRSATCWPSTPCG